MSEHPSPADRYRPEAAGDQVGIRRVVMRSIAVCLRVHRCGKRNSPDTYNLVMEPQPGLPTGTLRHTHTRGGFVTYRGRFADLAAARAAVAAFLTSRSSTLTVSKAGDITRHAAFSVRH
jgi:hypothetical protein